MTDTEALAAAVGATARLWQADFLSKSTLFSPLTPVGQAFRTCRDWPSLDELNAVAQAIGLTTTSGLALRFVKASPRPRGGARRRRAKAGLAPSYEERVYTAGEVPTRARSWHDFFNALVWFSFAATKAALNKRHIDARVVLPKNPVASGRTREQDFLTMFDEGGIIRLQPTGTTARSPVCLAFGHALYEAAMVGQTDIYGLTTSLAVTSEQADLPMVDLLALVDRQLATSIAAGLFTTGAAADRVALRDLM